MFILRLSFNTVQIEYYDGQFDDARYALALAQTAALHGAAVLNHAPVERLLRDPSSQRVIGAVVRDAETNKTVNVHAKVVVNAAGPFADDVRRMSQGEATPGIVRPSAGVHCG
jgi:glycerol-3-phosphate dehydrogenase